MVRQDREGDEERVRGVRIEVLGEDGARLWREQEREVLQKESGAYRIGTLGFIGIAIGV